MIARIRQARATDGNALIGIERAAGARFRDVGMPEIADDDPGSVDELAEYAADGRSWVAVDDADTPLGYVLVDVVDGNAHIAAGLGPGVSATAPAASANLLQRASASTTGASRSRSRSKQTW